MTEKVLDVSQIAKVGDSNARVTNEAVTKELEHMLRDYSMHRTQMEWYWKSYYTSYLTTPEAKRQNLTNISQNISDGNVNVQWRHNIKSPKTYEVVETLVSYFMNAFFPNERWFDLVPLEPMGIEFNTIIEINREFIRNKLDLAQFKSSCRVLLRETCIAGTACLMFPWVEDNVRFKVLSPFEFLLDPEAQMANDANFIRSYEVSLPKFKQLVKDDVFNLVSQKEVDDMSTPSTPPHDFRIDKDTYNSTRTLMGMTDMPRRHEAGRFVRIYEFWGDIVLEDVVLMDVRASWTDDGVLLALDANPYTEKPFIIPTYLRLSQSPYGIGAVQPIASQVFYKDQLTSRNADNVAVSSDTMLEIVQDGILDPDDIYVAPGKKFFVAEQGTVNPINMQYAGGVTVQELGLMDQVMDKAIGTGPFIGVGQGRQAERVTAAEVQAQRDVGGTRLTDVFSELESIFLLPFLERFHEYCRQFYQGGSIIRLGTVHIPVDPNLIDVPMRVKALGAANVADREYNLRQLLDWLAIVGQNEMMSQMVNWGEVLKELTYMMNPMIAERIVGGQQQQQQAPTGLGGELAQSANFLGGNAGQQALQAAEQAGSLPGLTENLASNLGLSGVNPNV